MGLKNRKWKKKKKKKKLPRKTEVSLAFQNPHQILTVTYIFRKLEKFLQ